MSHTQRLVDQLLSDSGHVRDRAIERARELARRGDRTGLDALGAAIQLLSGNPSCKFYKPGLRVTLPGTGSHPTLVAQQVLQLASTNQLLQNPKHTQALLAQLPSDLFDSLWSEVQLVGDERQWRAFQLVATHLVVHAELVNWEREKCEFEDGLHQPSIPCPRCNRPTLQSAIARRGHCHRCEDERKRHVGEGLQTAEGFDHFIAQVLVEEANPSEASCRPTEATNGNRPPGVQAQLPAPRIIDSARFCEAILKAENARGLIEALASSDTRAIEAGLDAVPPQRHEDFVEAARHVCPWLTLARILVAYEVYRAKGAEWSRLPEALDHKRCWQILHKRLFPLVQQNAHAAVIQKDTFDLAMALMWVDRDVEALDYLLAARPGVAADHEFWVFACMYNLVSRGHPRGDREALVVQGEAIEAGQIRVPNACRQEVRNAMQRLRSETASSSSGEERPRSARQTPADSRSAGATFSTWATGDPATRIRTTCPNPRCRRSFNVSHQHIGKRARCKACDTQFVVASEPELPASGACPPESRKVQAKPAMGRTEASDRRQASNRDNGQSNARARRKQATDRAKASVSTGSSCDDFSRQKAKAPARVFLREVRWWLRCTDPLTLFSVFFFLLALSSLFILSAIALAVSADDWLGLACVAFLGVAISFLWSFVYLDVRRCARQVTVLCVCKECGTRYLLGVNAIVTTLNDAIERLRRGGGMEFGAPPTATADLVGLEFGETSWPEGQPPQPPLRPYPPDVLLSRGLREFRMWRCANCDAIQPYDWWATHSARSPAKQGSLTTGAHTATESEQRRVLVRTPAPLGPLGKGGWFALGSLGVFPGSVVGAFVGGVIGSVLEASDEPPMGFIAAGAMIPPIAFLYTYATTYIRLTLRRNADKFTLEQKQRLLFLTAVDTVCLEDQFGIVIGLNRAGEAAVRLVHTSGRTACTIYTFAPSAIPLELRYTLRISDGLRVPIRYDLSERMALRLSHALGLVSPDRIACRWR